MNRDSFYQKICDRLSAVTDGDLFEKCAVSLLSKEWPNLLPVPGGQYAGMDGAFVENQGSGLLVATIRKDVIGNVAKNLKKHRAEGGTRDRVLVATTQVLTPRRCRSIEAKIRELGFKVAHHPYTSDAIAERLYHDSRWCRELLGVSGRPPALSRIPKGLRPLRDLPLLNRDSDYAWIENTPGDKVILGQPGVGKTYLLEAIVKAGKGLFVVDDDIERVTDGIRDQKVSTILIEDAHLRVQLIEALQRYRFESGLTFAIIVDSWPAAKHDVCQVLGVGENNCRELSPFSPTQIVELIRSAGIGGPNHLMHQLVRQSGGFAGRAAMLCHVCISQGAREVWDGSALTRWVHVTFAKLVSEKSLQILAGFAFGGRAGIRVNEVASALGYPSGEIRESMAKLAFGGVLQEISHEVLCVVPTPLCCSLVKEYFFDRKPSLPFDEFLNGASSVDSVFGTLIGAKVRGASIPLDKLLDLFERSSNSDEWEAFVLADRSYAEIVFAQSPERIDSLKKALLQQIADGDM